MDARYGRKYSATAARHWWWRARETLVRDTLEVLPLPEQARILDFGCGDAITLPMLERFGSVRGIEVDEDLLTPDGPYRDRIDTAFLGDPLYAGRSYDLITALDVIEHIEDDAAAVSELRDMLVPGGWLVVTVPASMRLWSSHDAVNQHFRRYDRADLTRLLGGTFEVHEVRYLFSSLYLPKYLVARLEQWRGGRTGPASGGVRTASAMDARASASRIDQTGIPPAPLNGLLRALLVAEGRLTRPLGLSFGSSLLAVARRPAA